MLKKWAPTCPPPSLPSILPHERCLQGNGRNYFKKRAEGSGGSRWWLRHLEEEAGGSGPSQRQWSPSASPSQKVPGQGLKVNLYRGAFLASQSKDGALDLAVCLTHVMTLEKFQLSSLLACGQVGGPRARGWEGKRWDRGEGTEF